MAEQRSRYRRSWLGIAVGLVTLLALAACQGGAATPAQPAGPGAPEATSATAAQPGAAEAGKSSPAQGQKVVDERVQALQDKLTEGLATRAQQDYTAKLEFTPPLAEVGKTVDVRGSGYPAGAEVRLNWYSAEGRYELEGGTEFVGQRVKQVSRVITSITADQAGSISAKLEVPPDFGGPHDVRGQVDGKEISQASLTIMPSFAISPREGPVGTPIELRATGIDWRPNQNTWHVLWDKSYFGFLSAVTTKGVAVARFRAAGPVGERRISVWRNSFQPTPYLNWYQGPYKSVASGIEFPFKVTSDPGAHPPQVEDFAATDNPWAASTKGPGKLTLSVDRGAVGQRTVLRGSGLPANADLAVRWSTMVGNRVSAIGFSEEIKVLGDARTGPDGTFATELAIPDDLGGQHRIEVAAADGKVLGATGLVIQPSVVSFNPTRVRAGEQFKIQLKGVGWATYDNTYAVTYDNSFIGYVCGFSSNGDVTITLTATGAPGTHIIDLYPTVYKGKDPEPRIYALPQLTYADDHPQRITPAIRMALTVAE